MDDLDNELDKDIGDHIDDIESLPFRYLESLEFPLRAWDSRAINEGR